MANCTIYKYSPLDTNTIANLVNNTIYFNNVSNFDDPTDAAFIVLTGGEAINKDTLSRENLNKLYKFMGIKYIHVATDEEVSLKLIQACKQIEEALKKYIGISCFSKHDVCAKCQLPQLNPLMLTHYSNRHAGIVIEYQCDKTEILKKVNYSHEYKHFNYADVLKNLTTKEFPKMININDNVIKPLLFKFNEWNYQNEHRIFHAPKETLSCTELALKVKRIFFGYRVDKHIFDSVIEILSNRDINFHFLRLPISNNDQQRIIINDNWAGGKVEMGNNVT